VGWEPFKPTHLESFHRDSCSDGGGKLGVGSQEGRNALEGFMRAVDTSQVHIVREATSLEQTFCISFKSDAHDRAAEAKLSAIWTTCKSRGVNTILVTITLLFRKETLECFMVNRDVSDS